MSTSVGFIGWNSAQRAWNTSAWNTSPAFALTATGAVGLAAPEGDAIIGPTGVAGTSAVGDLFTTNVGVTSTGAVGSATVTGIANVSVTGVAGTSALGNLFTTNMGFGATASVNSATVSSIGVANVYVTGVSATGVIAPLIDFPVVWGQIIPSQTSNFSAISPSQDPSWTDIAA